MKTHWIPALALSLAALAAHAAPPAKAAGGMLVNTAGMTLYTFDNDPAGGGKSVCNGPCAGNWPPVMATADDKAEGDWTIITRDDGSKQWAFKGKPLYLYKADTKPGDKSGDKFRDVWHIVPQ
jgi:predicted lipoprotein with Yx(FWY)xxD motif